MSEVLTSPKIPAESLPSKPSVESQTVSKENHAETGVRPQRSRLRRVAAAVMSWIPSVIVVAGLGGLAWYGHHNDWRMPSFRTTASLETAGPAWCDSHGVPEEECINCIPGLIEDPPKLTFCDVHGIHGCVLHDPSLAETKSPVEVTAADLERAERALAVRPRRENLPLSQLPVREFSLLPLMPCRVLVLTLNLCSGNQSLKVSRPLARFATTRR